MKQYIIFFILIMTFLWFIPNGFCESMDELINQFGQDYESLKPEKNSSIHTDYKLEQAALGTYYTTKAINLLYTQNQELISKYDQMVEKYNEIVDQNKEVIRLLTIISEKNNKRKIPKP